MSDDDNRSRPGLYLMIIFVLLWCFHAMREAKEINRKIDSGQIQVQCK